MARRVVGDFLSRRAAEVRIETRFVTDGPEELAWIHDSSGDLFRGLPVFRSDERRVFSAHHHRASRVDGDDLCSSLDERQQDSQVHLHAAAKRLQVAALPRRHAATFETVGATDIDRSEEHTSELQSPCNLVCRLLLEKKKNIRSINVARLPIYPTH